MFRMSDKINQVVVGSDHMNPLDCHVSNVWKSKDETRGKVRLKGKKYPVIYIGGGVWKLTDNRTTRAIFPEMSMKEQRHSAISGVR